MFLLISSDQKERFAEREGQFVIDHDERKIPLAQFCR
jgi:hypothetical protein